jgi:hypothetical protein
MVVINNADAVGHVGLPYREVVGSSKASSALQGYVFDRWRREQTVLL